VNQLGNLPTDPRITVRRPGAPDPRGRCFVYWMQLCDEVRASLVVGDETPCASPRRWRESAAKKLTMPLWNVDADMIVPSKLVEKEQVRRPHHPPAPATALAAVSFARRNPAARILWEG
jgi:deoxyribodipyrimidine photo-lyase